MVERGGVDQMERDDSKGWDSLLQAWRICSFQEERYRILHGKIQSEQKGSWSTVEHILGMLAAGDTPETTLEGYPWLEMDDIKACPVYARRLVSHERVEPLLLETGTWSSFWTRAFGEGLPTRTFLYMPSTVRLLRFTNIGCSYQNVACPLFLGSCR